MAKCSNALPLIGCCAALIQRFKFRPGEEVLRHVRMLPVTWGLAVVSAGYSKFPTV